MQQKQKNRESLRANMESLLNDQENKVKSAMQQLDKNEAEESERLRRKFEDDVSRAVDEAWMYEKESIDQIIGNEIEQRRQGNVLLIQDIGNLLDKYSNSLLAREDGGGLRGASTGLG